MTAAPSNPPLQSDRPRSLRSLVRPPLNGSIVGRTDGTTQGEMLSEYIRLAGEHGRALEDGDTNQSNTLNLSLIDLFKRFVGQGVRDRLRQLLSHSDPSVRFWAAVHTLTIEPDRAQGVLEELSEGKGPVAFNALLYAREWATGSIPMEGDPLWPPSRVKGEPSPG